MPLTLRTRLEALSPERIALTVNGRARVRVRGEARGYLRCGRERRWVWGAFDETFLVQAARLRELDVEVLGLGGWAQRRLPVEPALDLKIGRPRALPGRLRWSLPSVPRLPALGAAAIQKGLGAHD